MNRKKLILTLVILISILALSACAVSQTTTNSQTTQNTTQEKKSTETATELPPTSVPTLSVEVGQLNQNIQIIETSPIEGERLGLSSSIKLVFNQNMDQSTFPDVWTFTDANQDLIDGEISWENPRTFIFTPSTQLQPESTYFGQLSTLVTSMDGQNLPELLTFEYTTQEPIKVSQTFPEDLTEDVETSSSITVIFNRPIVPLSIKEEQADFPQPLIINPQVNGTGEWINSTIYIFYPEESLHGGTTYVVNIDPDLEDISGNKINETYTWQFSTRDPQITNLEINEFYWSNININTQELNHTFLDPQFRITFSQPMDQTSVETAIKFIDRESDQPINFSTSWNEDFTAIEISFNQQLKINGYYNFELSPGVISKDKGIIQEGLNFNVNTITSPMITGTDANLESRQTSYMPWVRVRFATPMDSEKIEDYIVISPEPEEGIHSYYSEYDQELTIYGLSPATEHIIRILPGLKDIYGNQITTEYSFTVKVGEQSPYANLLLPWTPLIYRAQGIQDVYIEYTNLDQGVISLYELSFTEFKNYYADSDYDINEYQPSANPINTWLIESGLERNKSQYRKIDLETMDGESLPPGYYLIGLQSDTFEYKENFYDAHLFIVGTDNITLKITATEALAWATDLEEGNPQKDLSVIFYDEDFNVIKTATTDQDGIAYLDDLSRRPAYARINGESHLGLTSIYWGSGVSTSSFGIWQSYYGSSASYFAYLQTDRPLYRPGQTVQFNGILRHQDDLHYTLTDLEQVYVEIYHQGEILYQEYLDVTQGGNFADQFIIAEDASLGTYDIYVYNMVPEQDLIKSISFRVAEYHKPEFEINVDSDLYEVNVGDNVTFSLDAAYYAGGNLANAVVDWFVETYTYYFVPSSDYQKYSFTDWDRDLYRYDQNQTNENNVFAEGESTTDVTGHLEITQNIPANEDKTSQLVYFGVNITDIAGNVVSGSTSIVAHQNQVYVGIRSQHYIGKAGEEQGFDIITLDWDSQPVPNQRVTVEFFERQWYSVQEKDDQGVLRWNTTVKEIPVAQKTVYTDQDGFVTTSFIPSKGGVYKVLLTTYDQNGNKHQSSSYMWVSGSNSISWRQTNDRSFELISDKDLYAPGDIAEILIAQPFEGENYALVTYERGHIYHSEVLKLTDNSTIYKMPITTEMTPITYLSITVVNGAQDGSKPNFKMGMIPIYVDTDQQTLQVTVTADKELAQPGEEITYTIETKDFKGDPVSANVTLAVVDKSILALTSSNITPIVRAFYPEESLYVRTASGIVASADDYNVEFRETIQDGLTSGGGGEGASQGIVTVRQNFKDTVVFESNIETDENGIAYVTVTLPDNLTTWQATARAVTQDSKVGEATSELLSTRPLYVNLTTPRFFVVGDQVVIGANVHNNSDNPMTVDLELEASGVKLQTPSQQTVEVPAQQQAYVYWEVTAKNDVDRVDLTLYASNGQQEDATKPVLGTLPDQGIPVYNYTVQETVGTSGMVEESNSATEGIYLPQTIDYDQAHISVEVSPSLAASMTESLTYLKDYPYLCIEQTISRFLPNVIIAQILAERDLPLIADQEELDLRVNSALQRIYAKQQSDGGWSWWDSGKSNPYLSAYVVYGLVEAQESYSIDQKVIDRGISYMLKNFPVISNTTSTSDLNRYAFMIYVASYTENYRANKINNLYNWRDSLSNYAKAYLLQAMYLSNPEDSRIQTLLSDLHSDVIISSTGAHWEEDYNDFWNWNTDLRTTAIVLNALIDVEGRTQINANAVRWLMANREFGRWKTTQENTWSLIALTNWMDSSGELNSDYEYAIGLNGELLEKGNVTSENLIENINLSIDMEDLLRSQLNALVFAHGEGQGNLYYTTFLTANLQIDQIKPLDQGMTITREYFTLDDPDTPITQIEQGELVRVRLTMIVPGALHYLVVNDPLPAGFEAIDSSIETDTVVPSYYTREMSREMGWGWWLFDHIEKRDEKVVLVADYLPAGTYIYTYLARASTVGTYNVIPPTVEEFYFPDVGGRGAGSKFTVLP